MEPWPCTRGSGACIRGLFWFAAWQQSFLPYDKIRRPGNIGWLRNQSCPSCVGGAEKSKTFHPHLQWPCPLLHHLASSVAVNDVAIGSQQSKLSLEVLMVNCCPLIPKTSQSYMNWTIFSMSIHCLSLTLCLFDSPKILYVTHICMCQIKNWTTYHKGGLFYSWEVRIGCDLWM